MLKNSLFVLLILVVPACAPSPVQLTSTANAAIAQTETAAPTDTLTPTATETPEPTATYTVTPSPTVTPTVTPTVVTYTVLPPLQEYRKEVAEYCEVINNDAPFETAHILASVASGRDVSYVVNQTQLGPDFDQIYTSFSGSITCKFILWGDIEGAWGYESPHQGTDFQWNLWQFKVIAVYYGPDSPDANEDGFVVKVYIPSPSP